MLRGVSALSTATLNLLRFTKTVSASVRSGPCFNQGAVLTANNYWVSRCYDKTNVVVNNPFVKFWNGYCDTAGGGGVGTSEVGTGNAITVRAALVTNLSGYVGNQATATLWKCTFYNMLKDGAFVQAGGAVSADGFTVTIPDTKVATSDPIPGLTMAAGSEYYVQHEEVYVVGSKRITGRSGRSDLGDRRRIAGDTGTNLVYNLDFTNGTLISAGSSHTFMMAVLGQGSNSTKVVGVEGDSIINGTGDITAYGDANGVTGFARRALNAAGYSYVDISIPGQSINDYQTYGGWNIRMSNLLTLCDAILTDMGNNDRNLSASWAIAQPKIGWHTGLLRTYAPAAKIIRCSFPPLTTSTDSWATTVNQSYNSAQTTYPTGWVFTFKDYLNRVGAYAGIPFSGLQDPDAGYDLYAGLQSTTDGKWPANGTVDGTHPVTAEHIIAATDLQPKLPSLLGF